MVTLVPVIFKNWEMISGQTRILVKLWFDDVIFNLYPTEVQQAFQAEHTLLQYHLFCGTINLTKIIIHLRGEDVW